MTKVRGVLLAGHWLPAEVAELERALEVLPDCWLSGNNYLARFERRPVLTDAPPDAPGHSKYDPQARAIVVYDKGVYHAGKIDETQFRRSIYHELAHTLLRGDASLLQCWRAATVGDGFVDDYARTSPEEDFADSFSENLLTPARARRAVPRKSAFLSHLLADARQHEVKVAMLHPFLYGFVDELTKTGAKVPQGLISRMASKVPRLGGAGKALAAGAAGVGAYAVGHHKGENKGIEEGVEGMDEGMQQAYHAGVQRGARAMEEAVRQQLAAQGHGGK